MLGKGQNELSAEKKETSGSGILDVVEEHAGDLVDGAVNLNRTMRDAAGLCQRMVDKAVGSTAGKEKPFIEALGAMEQSTGVVNNIIQDPDFGKLQRDGNQEDTSLSSKQDDADVETPSHTPMGMRHG